jgi:hypothetical protein
VRVAAGDVVSPQVDATAGATTRSLRVRSDGPGSAGMIAKDMGRTRRDGVGTPRPCPSLQTFTTSMVVVCGGNEWTKGMTDRNANAPSITHRNRVGGLNLRHLWERGPVRPFVFKISKLNTKSPLSFGVRFGAAGGPRRWVGGLNLWGIGEPEPARASRRDFFLGREFSGARSRSQLRIRSMFQRCSDARSREPSDLFSGTAGGRGHQISGTLRSGPVGRHAHFSANFRKTFLATSQATRAGQSWAHACRRLLSKNAAKFGVGG